MIGGKQHLFFFEHHGIEVKESFRYFPLVNYTFPLHFHRAYELIIVNEGELQLTVDQRQYSLKENDIAFIFNNQMHEFKTHNHSDISIVIFSPELIGHFFMNYKQYIPKNNVFQLSQQPNLHEMNSIYKQKSFLYDLCSMLVENTTFIPVEYSAQTKILHKILLFIDRNYDRDCTLKSVAKHLKYDYAYLSKLFVQLTDMSYTEYLNHFRISQACYLLKNSQQTIYEIASNCGYNNLRSFNRNFNKIMNQSPKQYRESEECTFS